jgi:PAS domain S-box-containing protein
MDEPTRILIAEDLEADFELARRELRKVVPNSEFQRVETKEAFVAALATFQPDVVISDFRMPVFDGLTALKLSLEYAPETPVIILTSAINEDTAVECMKAGAADYVIKEHLKRLGSAVVRSLGDKQERIRRRQAEAALNASNERLRQLAENIDSLLFVVDCDASGPRISYLSPACERIWGNRREDLFQDPFSWMERVCPEDRPCVEQAVRQLLSEGVPAAEFGYGALLADGAKRYIRIKAQKILSAEGGAFRVVGLAEDVTAQREAEQANAQLQAQFAQAQKMEIVGRLAGGVAHDFNNLLTVISGYSCMLLKELREGDPIRDRVAEIYKAGESAAGLTGQLLAFSRKQVLAPRRLDVNRVVEEMIPMLERLVGEDIEVRVALHAEGGTIHADPHQLKQVAMNLVVNARDAMPRGGKLLIETAIVEWDESDTRSHPEALAGRYVMLAVSDTGLGMDEATKNRIFEPFFTTKEAGRGTGLGLSMVQGIVTQSGGYIDVSSEKDKGTIFKIYLPALSEEAAATGTSPGVRSLGGKETVLVVEDQAEVRRYAVAVLKAYGYRALPVDSASEALLLCEREHPDLVLTDVVMPNMSGRELSDRLAIVQPGIKVLFMSGYTDSVQPREVLAEGAEFIQKPFGPDELADKIRAVLEQRRR